MMPLSAAALLLLGGLAVLLFRGSPEQQRAAHSQLEAPRAPSSERDVAASRSGPPSRAVTDAPKRDAELSQHSTTPPKRETERAKTTATASDAQPPTVAAQRAEPPATPSAPPRDSGASAREPEAQPNVTPRTAMERPEAKRELADRGDMRASAGGGRSDAAPSVAERQREVGAPTEDGRATAQSSATTERHAAPPVGAASPAPGIATAKAKPTPQIAPLSRTGPMTGLAAAPPDVTAQLRVANVSGAERALIDLASRVGGRQTGRRIAGGRLVVELAVPRDAYAEFVRDAAALGAMSIESQATDRPMLGVAVTVSN
jgi:hypothetical protein